MKRGAPVVLVAAVVLGSAAAATDKLLDEYKFYKRVHHATCQTCHVMTLPKRGEADLNDLGKKARRPNGTIDWAKVPDP
jgi:cytochrome c5